MDVSVITTVRDGERALPGLAAALRAQTGDFASPFHAQTRPDARSLHAHTPADAPSPPAQTPADTPSPPAQPRAFEWVVIDNASSDGTAEVARSLGAVVVAEPSPGRAGARNRGVAASSGALLAFTDVDCRPRTEWLSQLAGCLAAHPLAGGPVVLTLSERPSAAERLDALWRFRQRTHVERDGWAATANLGMRREAFDAIGGFDATLTGGGEDVDLCLRARAAGFAIGWCPGAVVEHPAETSLRSVLRRAFEQAVSLDMLHHRHGLAPGHYWRHPGPVLRGDYAVRRFNADLADVPPADRRAVLRLARLEYAARMAGSAWAPLANRRRRVPT